MNRRRIRHYEIGASAAIIALSAIIALGYDSSRMVLLLGVVAGIGFTSYLFRKQVEQ